MAGAFQTTAFQYNAFQCDPLPVLITPTVPTVVAVVPTPTVKAIATPNAEAIVTFAPWEPREAILLTVTEVTADA